MRVWGPRGSWLEWEPALEAVSERELARIIEHRLTAAEFPELWEGLVGAVVGAEAVVVELPVRDEGWPGFVQSHWLLEREVVGELALDTPRQARFQVRPAHEGDRLFMQLVYARNLEALVPPPCREQAQEIAQAYLWALRQRPVQSPGFLTWIAEERETLRKAGFLRVQLGEASGYLEDVHIHPDFFGSYAAQRLIREGELELARRGLKRWTAQVAEGNRRALLTATRSLGFKVRARRWERHVDEL